MVSVNLFKGAFNEFIILRCVIIKKKYVKIWIIRTTESDRYLLTELMMFSLIIHYGVIKNLTSFINYNNLILCFGFE